MNRSYSTTVRLAVAAALALAAILVVVVGVGALTSSDKPAPPRSATARAAVPQVRCADVIGSQSKPRRDQRVVLGAVLLPRRRIPGEPQLLPGASPLPYWTKQGLLIRAGRPPVVLTVPIAWRRRAGILWGGTDTPGPVERFPSCPGNAWLAFAGGFRLKDRSACLPLDVNAGTRRAHLEIGIGRECPSTAP